MRLLYILACLPDSYMIVSLIFAIFIISFLYFLFIMLLYFLLTIAQEHIFRFFEETVSNPAYCPVAQQCSGCQELVLVNSQERLRIGKKDFNVPTSANMLKK